MARARGTRVACVRVSVGMGGWVWVHVCTRACLLCGWMWARARTMCAGVCSGTAARGAWWEAGRHPRGFGPAALVCRRFLAPCLLPRGWSRWTWGCPGAGMDGCRVCPGAGADGCGRCPGARMDGRRGAQGPGWMGTGMPRGRGRWARGCPGARAELVLKRLPAARPPRFPGVLTPPRLCPPPVPTDCIIATSGLVSNDFSPHSRSYFPASLQV